MHDVLESIDSFKESDSAEENPLVQAFKGGLYTPNIVNLLVITARGKYTL